MAFREVQVHEIREVLRLWVRGEGLRSIERLAGVDRKTARRYLAAAQACGADRGGGEGQLGDELLSRVAEAVRPHRADGHGQAWAVLAAHHDELKALLDQGLTVVKAGELLARRGVVVPQRTLHRYALEVLGHGRSARGKVTVRVADGEPGAECQVDFGKMGLLPDPVVSGRRRVVHGLIFTAVYSRHCYVHLSFRQDLPAVIAGCEAAWAFFGGIFKIIIPDNMAAIVDRAHPLEPRLSRAFAEYAQDRGFLIDPARVRRPTDKPRVERMVPFVRGSFFAGEDFAGLADAQRRADAWCGVRAGQRIHRTTRCRPAELFRAEEAPRLLPAPVMPYDLPVYASPKVHRDHHIEVARALYSIPGALIGQRVDVRADSQLVRVWHRGVLVKVHPRTRPGGRVTDPADLPDGTAAYALRDIAYLQRLADDAGPATGAYAAALLGHPLPWTKMRQVYALLGLVRKWGPGRVDAACRRALEAEAISVPLVGRILAAGTENAQAQPALPFPAAAPRFARGPAHFATGQHPRGGAA